MHIQDNKITSIIRKKTIGNLRVCESNSENGICFNELVIYCAHHCVAI